MLNAVLLTAVLSCTPPTAEGLEFPDGARAGKVEMSVAVRAAERYLIDMDRFLICFDRETHERLRDEASQLWGAPPTLRHSVYVTVLRERTERYNRHVDQMKSVAARINAEIRKYNERAKRVSTRRI